MEQVSFERRGAGTPVVMIHGLGSRWQVFEPIIDAVAADHEVIALDLPGFGSTPAFPDVAPGAHGYASWLTDWFVSNDIVRPHVVGSSMGGGVALELGRTGVAASVTAFSPIGFYGTPGLRWVQGLLTGLRFAGRVSGPVMSRALEHPASKAVLLAALFGHPSNVPSNVAQDDVAALVGAPSFAAARDSFTPYSLADGDDVGSLAEIPTTVAWGTRDVVLTHRTQSRRARAALPFASHVDLDGCGHLPFSDDPATCADIVLDTIGAAESGRTSAKS